MKKGLKWDLPDVAEFIEQARSFIRQLQIMDAVNIPVEYRNQVDRAVENVMGASSEYVNKNSRKW